MAKKAPRGKSPQSVAEAVPAPAARTVWECRAFDDGCIVGYLVTEPGDINRPIAFTLFDNEAEETTCRMAIRIAEDPEKIWRSPHRVGNRIVSVVGCVDLRTHCRPDSPLPMPRFIYSLRCRRVDLAKFDPEINNRDLPLLDGPPIEPTPYCRFLAAEIAEARKGGVE